MEIYEKIHLKYFENKTWWENIISGEYKDYYKKMYENR